MPNKVNKMLSPEEQTLLANLKTILQELESLQQGGYQETEAPAEMSMSNKDLLSAIKKLTESNNLGDSTEEMGEEKKETKSLLTKEDNGPTANDNADERIDNQTDINDENMSEVGKTLIQLLQKKSKTVAKSNNIDLITNAVKKAIMPIVSKIQEIEKFNENMLDSLRFSEKIEKSLKDNQNNNQQVQKGFVNSNNAPVQTLDATAVVNQLVEVIKSQAVQNNQQSQFKNDWNGMQEARKDLKNALPFIFQNSKK